MGDTAIDGQWLGISDCHQNAQCFSIRRRLDARRISFFTDVYFTYLKREFEMTAHRPRCLGYAPANVDKVDAVEQPE